MDIEWNRNGNWLLTASRDHLLKLFDIRNTKEEIQTFRGHKKEASTLAWHPVHEGVFASGGSDGAVMFWNVGAEKEVGVIESAHESIVWSLAWHPIGHILCSGSNDHTCKFWTRNRPGDTMRDKYNLNTLPYGQEDESLPRVVGTNPVGADGGGAGGDAKAAVVIPGMAPEDRIEQPSSSSSASVGTPGTGANTTPLASHKVGGFGSSGDSFSLTIPGLDEAAAAAEAEKAAEKKKTPYAKPIPKNFQVRHLHQVSWICRLSTYMIANLFTSFLFSLGQLERHRKSRRRRRRPGELRAPAPHDGSRSGRARSLRSWAWRTRRPHGSPSSSPYGRSRSARRRPPARADRPQLHNPG